MTQPTGILGGTFDPVHNGHLALARHVLDAGAAGRVIFIPVRIPPHKSRPGLTPPRHRLAMLELAIADEPRFSVSSIEMEREGPSYTIDTLRSLAVLRPGEGFRLILGADMARELHLWREAAEVLRLAPPLFAVRPGAAESPEAILGELHPSLAPFLPSLREGLLSLPPCPVSSSAVRSRVREGKPVEDLVPEAVAEYMAAHRLYANT